VQLAGTSACPSVGHLDDHGSLGAVELDATTTYRDEIDQKVCEDQEGLAVVVYQMWLYRSVLLGLSTDHQSVPIPPEGYVPVDDALDAVAPSP
jgi:hypothetical protein